jgi:hypothetical protein
MVTIIALAIFAQAQPTPSNNVVNTSNGAIVSIQLPQGVPSHPVNLRISVMAIDNTSTSEGGNVMEFYLWVPAMNSYVPVAIVSTGTNQTVISLVKSIVNGTPIWTPPVMMNFFTANASQLQVSMKDQTLMANLTTSFNVTLPDSLGGNFTIPPMSLMFIPIASGFAHNETTVVPSSNWTISLSHTDVPSWVRVSIPMWLGSAPMEVVGTMLVNGTTTYIPPKT